MHPEKYILYAVTLSALWYRTKTKSKPENQGGPTMSRCVHRLFYFTRVHSDVSLGISTKESSSVLVCEISKSYMIYTRPTLGLLWLSSQEKDAVWVLY